MKITGWLSPLVTGVIKKRTKTKRKKKERKEKKRKRKEKERKGKIHMNYSITV